jgi:Family of unknown function (DUF6256)
MTPAGVLVLSLADRQALVPMAAGYLVLMSALGFGLRRLYRPAPSGAAEGPDPARATPPGPGERDGWAALLRRVAGIVVGGYLLLMVARDRNMSVVLLAPSPAAAHPMPTVCRSGSITATTRSCPRG